MYLAKVCMDSYLFSIHPLYCYRFISVKKTDTCGDIINWF